MATGSISIPNSLDYYGYSQQIQVPSTGSIINAYITVQDNATGYTGQKACGQLLWTMPVGTVNIFIGRVPVFFDTSVLNGLTIVGATASFNVSYLYGTQDFDIVIQNGQPYWPKYYFESSAASNYNASNYSGTGGSVNTSSLSVSGYFDIPLNSTGISWINTTGTTKFIRRSSRDIARVIPMDSVAEYLNFGGETGDINSPYSYLIVSYYIPTPTVTITKPVAHLSSTGVSVTGNITDLDGASATVRGFCYATGGTAVVPTVTDSTAGAAGSFGIGSFNYNITGVVPSQLYHVRSFAINAVEGTGYSSDQVHFDIETQSSSIGIKSLTPNKKVGIKKSTSMGIVAVRSPFKISKTFILAGIKRSFTYHFPFLFSTMRDGEQLTLRASKTPLVLTKGLVSKIGIYVDSLSLWEFVKNGVRVVIRHLSATLGVALPIDTRLIHISKLLSTKIGIASSYLKKFYLNRQISTKLGFLLQLARKGVNIQALFVKLGVYVKGLWSSYNYCKIVTINPSIDGALSSYPIKLTIHRTTGTDSGNNVYVGTDCSFDYSDIYFDTVEGEPLWYWIESYTDNEAIVWIKAINIPASPTTTSIRLYYGSAATSTRNNGENTFTFFDDFSAGLSKWTTDSGCSVIGEELVVQSTSTATKTAYSNTSFGINYAMRARLKSAHISGNYIEDTSISDILSGHGVGVSYCSYYTNNSYYNHNDAGIEYLPVSGWAANTYLIQDVIRTSTINKFYVSNTNYRELTEHINTDSHPIRFFTVNNTAKLTIDWVLIRPYTTNEPTFGIWGSKITTSGSPFKDYFIKLYRSVNNKLGLVVAKYKGTGHKFAAIKLGLAPIISSTRESIRKLYSKLGVNNKLVYALSFLRFLNSPISFALRYGVGFTKVLITSFGLVLSVWKFVSYTLRVSIGVISIYEFSKKTYLYLSTAIGIMNFSTGKISTYIKSLTTTLGIVVTQGIKGLAKVFASTFGLTVSYIYILKSYFKFITFIGFDAGFVKYTSIFKTVSNELGLITIKGVIKLATKIKNSLGLVTSYNKKLSYGLKISLGLLSVLRSQINIYQILNKSLGISLVGDTKAYFEEFLSTTFGLVSDTWYKAGGRVRELIASFGLVSSLLDTNKSYYRGIITNLSVVAIKIYNINITRYLISSLSLTSSLFKNITINLRLISSVGLSSIIFIHINSLVTITTSIGLRGIQYFKLGVILSTSLGLITIKGIVKQAIFLITKIGLISILDSKRHDFETFMVSMGLKVTVVSRLFGLKRFKSLKFLDPKTSDNKKLRIKK